MSSKRYIAALVMVAVGIGSWLALRESKSSATAVDVVRPTPLPGHAADGVADVLRVPVEPSSIATPGEPAGTGPIEPEPAAPAAREPWHAAFPRARVPQEVFERKYAGLGHEDLRRARDALYERWTAIKDANIDERYRLGLFERRPTYIGGMPGSDKPGFALDQHAGDPIARLYVTKDSSEAHIVVLPLEEYPELYDLCDEWAWLMQQVSQVESQEKQQG